MMEGKKNKSRALMVFGAPCSGKSTFAKKFAEKFGLAYYNFDEIKKKHDFSLEEIYTILELILLTRQTIIFEGLLDTEKERAKMKEILKKEDYEPRLIWVQTDVATIRARMKAKYKSVSEAKNLYNAAVGEMEAPSEAEAPIILSGKHTFETQTKHVVAGLADAPKRR